MSHTTLGTCEAAELDEDGLPIVPPDALPVYDDDEVSIFQRTATYCNTLPMHCLYMIIDEVWCDDDDDVCFDPAQSNLRVCVCVCVCACVRV